MYLVFGNYIKLLIKYKNTTVILCIIIHIYYILYIIYEYYYIYILSNCYINQYCFKIDSFTSFN